MDKDKNCKWNFVEMPDNVPSRSGEDSTFDHFRSKPYRFIVREFIQNSMDVPLDTKAHSVFLKCEKKLIS